MNIAIIVAAGTGSRFASNKAKQFVELGGKPIIIWTLERFEACEAMDEIVLVLSNDGKAEFERIGVSFSKLKKVIIGGATRAESVRNGLDAIAANENCIVAVHDGARPLVAADEIARTIATAKEKGAACLVAELNDTIKVVSDGKIERTVDRKKLRRALTPQAFRYDILKKAFDGADLGPDVTDECYLVERLGFEIGCVEGSSRNIKITRTDDIALAETYLRVM